MSKIKKADLLQLVQEQADMMVKLTGMVELNKQAIIKLENEREQPKLKTLDQSVFDGLDEKWRFAAFNTPSNSPILFSVRPHESMHGEWYTVLDCDEYMIPDELEGVYEYTDDWQNSLIERERKELTGSDLCRRLKSRKHWVLAVVSDENDATAEFHQRAVVVTDITNDGGFICGDKVWQYAVPIDHKGEPLTAADVGL